MKTRERNNVTEYTGTIFMRILQSRLAGGIMFLTCPSIFSFVTQLVYAKVPEVYG